MTTKVTLSLKPEHIQAAARLFEVGKITRDDITSLMQEENKLTQEEFRARS